MKNLNLLLFLALLFVGFGCNKDGEVLVEETCDLIEENKNFNELGIDMDYEAITDILGQPASQIATAGYSELGWLYCNFTDLIITVKISNSKIFSKLKSFSNEACSNQVTIESFNEISIGDSYQNLVDIFGDEGDTYFVEYRYQPELSQNETIVWYDCVNTDKRIQVVLEDQKVVSKEESL